MRRKPLIMSSNVEEEDEFGGVAPVQADVELLLPFPASRPPASTVSKARYIDHVASVQIGANTPLPAETAAAVDARATQKRALTAEPRCHRGSRDRPRRGSAGRGRRTAETKAGPSRLGPVADNRLRPEHRFGGSAKSHRREQGGWPLDAAAKMTSPDHGPGGGDAGT